MSTATLTDEDLAFLALPLHGFLTVAAGPQPPQPRPVWFEATLDGTLQLFTAPGSVKVRRLRRDPRAHELAAILAADQVRVCGPRTLGRDATMWAPRPLGVADELGSVTGGPTW